MDVISSLHTIDICTVSTCKAAMIGVLDRVLIVGNHHNSKSFWTPAIGEQLIARPGHALINQY